MKASSHKYVVSVLTCLFVSVASVPAAVQSIEQRKPLHRAERVLVASEPAMQLNYRCFPSVLDLGNELLVSFKRGSRHGSDTEALLDLISIDGRTRAVSNSRTIAKLDGKIMQMGEWVRFPNGDLANYIDAQEVDAHGRNQRIGVRAVRSTDGGRTFGPVERVGVVDGVEYGYPFSFVVEGSTTWMLVMSFANLQGGYSTFPPRPHAGPVSVIRSDDNGRSWRFVRNLTREFGDVPINESFFVRHRDGFLVVTRGYDNRARLHLTGGDLKVMRQVDLTEIYPFIDSYVGRPRLFVREGRIYLIGRNWTQRTDITTGPLGKDGVPTFPAAMKMCLFRLDADELAVTAYAVLDNTEEANVTDAYYPAPYFREVEGRTRLYVVDYKGLNRQPPQIVEFEYLWDEVK
jgi:hypothetical protein